MNLEGRLRQAAVAAVLGASIAASGARAWSNPAFPEALDGRPPSSEVLPRVHLERLGSLNLPSDVVAASGTFAYAAAQSGLSVVDFSDPANPQVVQTVDDVKPQSDMIMVGDRALYVADKAGGVRVIDVSDPQNPMDAFTLNIPPPFVLAPGQGEYVLAGRLDELLAVDTSNPLRPRVVNTFQVKPFFRDMAVSDDRAYVTQGISPVDFGILVIDFSNPYQMREAAKIQLSDLAVNIAIADSTIAVGCGMMSRELCTVDVSDPENPREMGSVRITGDIGAITKIIPINPETVLALSPTGGSALVDVSHPEGPYIIQEVSSAKDGFVVAGEGDDIIVMVHGYTLSVSRLYGLPFRSYLPFVSVDRQ